MKPLFQTTNHSSRIVLFVLALGATASASAIDVADFGALPNDGKCDTLAIEAAIQAARRSKQTEIRFAAGTYNLTRTVTGGLTGKDYYLGVNDAENLAFIGATDEAGRPATRLERTIVLNNDAAPPNQISVQHSRNIAFRNFIFANNPPLGTTARVVAVDKARDEVVVEVLKGLPAYDGMRCASAHAWDLATGHLKRFGRTPTEATLTIGMNIKAYWKAVPDTHARQLKMQGAGFAAKLEVGDGRVMAPQVERVTQPDVGYVLAGHRLRQHPHAQREQHGHARGIQPQPHVPQGSLRARERQSRGRRPRWIAPQHELRPVAGRGLLL